METAKKVHKKKREHVVSKTGRVIKTPKKIMTTSSDDAPVRKIKKLISNVNESMDILKTQYNGIERSRNNTDGIAEKQSRKSLSTPTDTLTGKRHKSVTFKSSAVTSRELEANQELPTEDEVFINNSVPDSANIRSLQHSDTLTAKRHKNVTFKSSTITSRELDANQELPTEDEVFINNSVPDSANIRSLQHSHNIALPSTSTSTNIYSINAEVLEKIRLIEKQNQKIISQNTQILNQLLQTNEVCKLSQTLLQPINGYPLQTVEQFKTLESADNKDKRRELYNHLLNLGGSRLRDFLHSALKETMTDELVCRFTWPGGEKHEKFGDTKITNVLYQAAIKCTKFVGPTDKDHFKREMLEVMRSAKQRYRNSNKRTSRNVADQLHSEETEEETDESEDEQFADDETSFF